MSKISRPILLALVTVNACGENNYKNSSPIEFETIASAFYGNIHFCWRNRSGRVPLDDIGFYDHDIIRGLSCIVGDYDGNGFADFAFQGEKSVDGIRNTYLKVLFYEDKKLIREVLLLGDLFFLYHATKEEGEFGEPPSKTDGLTTGGEGDNTHVFLFDPETEKFIESEHGSEHN